MGFFFFFFSTNFPLMTNTATRNTVNQDTNNCGKIISKTIRQNHSERERDRETERDRDRQTETDRDRDRQTETEREAGRWTLDGASGLGGKVAYRLNVKERTPYRLNVNGRTPINVP